MWFRNNSRGVELHFTKVSIKKVRVRRSAMNILVLNVASRKCAMNSGCYSRKASDDCRLFVIEKLSEVCAICF